MLSEYPKARGWAYVIGAVLTFIVFVVVVVGLFTGEQIGAGLAAATLFVNWLLNVLAKANTPKA